MFGKVNRTHKTSYELTCGCRFKERTDRSSFAAAAFAAAQWGRGRRKTSHCTILELLGEQIHDSTCVGPFRSHRSGTPSTRSRSVDCLQGRARRLAPRGHDDEVTAAAITLTWYRCARHLQDRCHEPPARPARVRGNRPTASHRLSLRARCDRLQGRPEQLSQTVA